MVETTMDPVGWLRKQLVGADTDLLREMVTAFAEVLMGAEADALCNAAYGQRTADRENRRNGYRGRRWDTRAGTIDLQIPKLRAGSYFPDWLLERHRRAEQALVCCVVECYVRGVSTRRVDGLVRTLGLEGMPKARCRSWPRTSMRWWRRFGPDLWTPAPTPTCGWTPWSSSAAKPAGS